MEPTLKVGERVHVDTRAYRNANPKPGEIVVFHPQPRRIRHSRFWGPVSNTWILGKVLGH
jgi:signal peptidase I